MPNIEFRQLKQYIHRYVTCEVSTQTRKFILKLEGQV